MATPDPRLVDENYRAEQIELPNSSTLSMVDGMRNTCVGHAQCLYLKNHCTGMRKGGFF